MGSSHHDAASCDGEVVGDDVDGEGDNDGDDGNDGNALDGDGDDDCDDGDGDGEKSKPGSGSLGGARMQSDQQNYCSKCCKVTKLLLEMLPQYFC